MGKRVMILDDDIDILQICTIILQDRGYNVLPLHHSGQVMEEARNYHPDVILMDNWIPGFGGIKSTHLLKEDPQLNTIPVIFFSANSNVSDLAREARADYFLQKPFDIAELESIVQMAIRHELPASREEAEKVKP